jgi:hypothetical protein
MERSVARLLLLQRIYRDYGPSLAGQKLRLLRSLRRARLPSAVAVKRLHEILCFLRGFPDNRAVLGAATMMLREFSARSDLHRVASRLENSGIAGTAIVYPFFMGTAEWIASKWPEHLRVDWDAVAVPERDRIETWLEYLAHYGETPALDVLPLPLQEWIGRMKGERETDAAFLVRRYAALKAAPRIRQQVYEELDLTLRLVPGPGTPSRTLAAVPRPVHFQRGPLDSSRPDLRADLARAPFPVRAVGGDQGRRLIDLAREAMITRERDLDAFAYGDPRDVRIVDCGGGLELVAIGMVPERRLLLEAFYGLLTLHNGIPIGYVGLGALFGSAEVAYNVFDTWRGSEAARGYSALLTSAATLFRADAFFVTPYQLGDDNEEGIESGAWWFYRKLGFIPRNAAARALMRREQSRIRRNGRYRSNAATLRRLAKHSMFLWRETPRDDILGILPLERVGLEVMRYLSRRFGSDREAATETCALEAATRLGLRSPLRLNQAERLWWNRWAPLVLCLPGLERWNRAERIALLDVVRAKAGRRESDFVIKFDNHPRLRAALRRLVATRG